jgi:hypothetical protein
MSLGLSLVFWSLVLFEAKHFICDFVLQTPYQYRNKGIYGHPGGFVHAGFHGLGSIPAILMVSDSAWLVAVIVAAEFLFHYHVDWLKEQINKARALSFDDMLYWVVFGADQLLHQMSYVIILAVLARAANL